MAEPRRPRVIRSRPGAQTPTAQDQAAEQPGQVPNATKAKASSVSHSSNLESSKQAATHQAAENGAVRSTSSKVSVTAVPEETMQGTASKKHSSSASPTATGKPSAKISGVKTVPPVKNTGADGDGTKKSASRGYLSPSSAPQRVVAQQPSSQKPSKQAKAAKASEPGNTTGAKVLAFPVPAHRKRRRKMWITAASVVVVVALVMAVALFSPVLAVKSVAFEGRKLIAEKTLMTALEPIMNKPLPQVTGPEVTALLNKVPQVKSAWVEARPPSTLVVHLVERVPVALLKDGKSYILVDQEGVQLGSTTDPAKTPLPVIAGGKAIIGKDTFSAITAVLATLPASILSQLSDATAKSPDAVELNMKDGKLVVWGNATDRELKAEVLEALLNAPAPVVDPTEPAPAAVKVYDVSTPRYPVTR